LGAFKARSVTPRNRSSDWLGRPGVERRECTVFAIRRHCPFVHGTLELHAADLLAYHGVCGAEELTRSAEPFHG